jgi:colanic acid/amylovoran biosynthesis glycosyltransferase
MNAHSAIAYLVDRYPTAHPAGVLREAAELRRLGFDIRIAALRLPERPPEAPAEAIWCLRRQGVAGVLLGLMAALARPAGLWRGLKLVLALGRLDLERLAGSLVHLAQAAALGRWMRGQGLGHVHAQGAAAAIDVGVLAKALFGVNCSFAAQGLEEADGAVNPVQAARVRGADFVVCASHHASGQLRQVVPEPEWSKLEVCRPGVDPERYAPVARPARPDPFRLLCVGSLVPAHGQHVLLEALALLVGRGVRPQLTLVGDGPDRAALEARATALRLKDAVRFAGAVGQDVVLSLYERADAFVLPSLAEGLPVALLEAMAAGLPCVAAGTGGVPELIRDGEHGLLVAASDSAGLADAVERLMDDPGLRARLAEAGRGRVLADYVLKVNSARLGALFEERLRPGG